MIGDDHAVELFASEVVVRAVEHHHVLDGRVLRCVTLQLHKRDVELQRGVRQQAYQVGLRRNLQRHQVQDDDAQRADVLTVGACFVHHEDVFPLQQFYGGKLVGYSQWHVAFSFSLITSCKVTTFSRHSKYCCVSFFTFFVRMNKRVLVCLCLRRYTNMHGYSCNGSRLFVNHLWSFMQIFVVPQAVFISFSPFVSLLKTLV